VPLSRNLGALTSWNPLGLSRPVMGLIYLIPGLTLIYIYIYIYIYIVHTVCLRVLYVCYKRGWLLFLNTAWIIGCITEAECVYSAVRIDPFEKPQFRRTLWRRSGTLQPIALSYAAIAPMSALWTSSSFGIDHWVLAPFPNSCRFRTKFDSMPKRPWLAHCDRPTCVS